MEAVETAAGRTASVEAAAPVGIATYDADAIAVAVTVLVGR
jgi:hypothetical protein